MFRVLKKTSSFLPFFALIALTGCSLAYFVAHAPLEQLGLIVSVPIVVAFLISRVILLAMPRRRFFHHDRTHISVTTVLVVMPIFLGLTISTVFFFSSVIFRAIGLPEASSSSYYVAVFATALYLAWGSMILLLTRLAARNVVDRVRFVIRKLVEYFWDTICLPGRVLSLMARHPANAARGHSHG